MTDDRNLRTSGPPGGPVSAEASDGSPLAQVLAKLESIERRLDRIESRARQNGPSLLPEGESPAALLATFTDTMDDLLRRLAERGIDVDDRGRRIVCLLEDLTRPETLSTINQSLQALRELPGLISMAADSLDEAARRAGEHGIDLDRSLRNGLRAALRFAQSFGETEVDRLTEFLDSDVLHPAALRTVGDAGCALAEARSAAPPKVGLFGLLSALRDPAVQSALGFAIRFAQAFGQTVSRPAGQRGP